MEKKVLETSEKTEKVDGNTVEPVKEEIKTSGINKEVEDLLSGYKEQMIVDEPKKEVIKDKRGRKKKIDEPDPEPVESSIISGALLILMIDLVIPNIMVFVNNKVTGEKLKVKDLQLTRSQQSELQPIADEVAKNIALRGNPLTVLIVTLIGIYGINLMALKAK